MRARTYVHRLLKEAGISRWALTRNEANTLASFLKKDESIEACVKGFYRGGRAVFVATSRRLLLLDKRISSLYTRAVAYDSISNISVSRKFSGATIFVTIQGKDMYFKTTYASNLHRLASFLRGKVLASQKNKSQTNIQLPVFLAPNFEERKRVLSPRHRHGKFLISLR